MQIIQISYFSPEMKHCFLFKVFKHTFDVLEDYISGFLIAAGAISLSVRYRKTNQDLGFQQRNISFGRVQKEKLWFTIALGAIPLSVRYRKRKIMVQDCTRSNISLSKVRKKKSRFRIALREKSFSVRCRKRIHGLGLHQELYSLLVRYRKRNHGLGYALAVISLLIR